jgi:hypothetical protein
MDSTRNTKNRKLKSTFGSIIHSVSFEMFNMSNTGKVILLWLVISYISLVCTWVTFSIGIGSGQVLAHTAWSVYTGNIGYIIFTLCSILLFFTLSNNKKERARAVLGITYSDGQIATYIGSILVCICIFFSQFVPNFDQFATGISLWNGFVFAMIWWVVICTGGMVRTREERSEKRDYTYLTRSLEDIEKSEYDAILGTRSAWKDTEDTNMKLPV